MILVLFGLKVTPGSINCCLQIEAYRDMIAPVVDAFKYLTQVCDDIFFFHELYICSLIGFVMLMVVLISLSCGLFAGFD